MAFGFDTLVGLTLVILALALMLLFALSRQLRTRQGFRSIPALQHMRRTIGLSVEAGKRVHVSVGQSNLLGTNGTAALAGLGTLERIAQLSMVSDRPPVATSGEGSLSILTQDTLRAAYRNGNALDQYDPHRGRLTGVTPFSFIAGAITTIPGDQVSTNILVGSFGAEVGLLCESADQHENATVAGSDTLPGQAVLYAAAQDVLLGEELYAVPAYLQAGPVHSASLRVQDVLRWVIITALLAGGVLKLVTQVLGVPFP